MDIDLRLTRLSELGNGVILYGLQYPGFHGCVSWCYLTIGPGVIIASQPELADCDTSITNNWDEYFIRLLEDLPEVGAAGSSPHWYEHYYGPEGPELDEVFLTPEGHVNWKFGGRGVDTVAAAFEHLTGEPEPDFAATGFEEEMSAVMHARRGQAKCSGILRSPNYDHATTVTKR